MTLTVLLNKFYPAIGLLIGRLYHVGHGEFAEDRSREFLDAVGLILASILCDLRCHREERPARCLLAATARASSP